MIPPASSRDTQPLPQPNNGGGGAGGSETLEPEALEGPSTLPLHPGPAARDWWGQKPCPQILLPLTVTSVQFSNVASEWSSLPILSYKKLAHHLYHPTLFLSIPYPAFHNLTSYYIPMYCFSPSLESKLYGDKGCVMFITVSLESRPVPGMR